ncbi:MAG: ROK family protein [Steroidobacteraceae bacterium]
MSRRDSVLAVDVGGTKTALVVSPVVHSARATITPSASFATPKDPQRFITILRDAVSSVSGDARVLGVGMGVPGPLDRDRGIVRFSTNLGWRNVPIAALVSHAFGGIPVSIDDDANAGALGEAVYGAGRNADPFVFVTLGTGLGSGIVVGGTVVAGHLGAAGEIGHLCASFDGPLCACGRRGCVEAYVGGLALERRWREAGRGTADAATVFALARRGDVDALRVVQQAREALALAFASLMASVAPARIAVAGTVGLSQKPFVRAAFRLATSAVYPGGRCKLRAGELGADAVLAGAAALGRAAIAKAS